MTRRYSPVTCSGKPSGARGRGVSATPRRCGRPVRRRSAARPSAPVRRAGGLRRPPGTAPAAPRVPPGAGGAGPGREHARRRAAHRRLGRVARPAGQPLHDLAQAAQAALAAVARVAPAGHLVHDDGRRADVEERQRFVAVVFEVADPSVQHVAGALRGDGRERLGAHPDHDPLAVVVRHRPGADVVPRQVERLLAEREGDVAVEVDVDRRLQQVHPRAAQERGHVEGGRTAVHLGGRADVLEDAATHDRHPVGHGERFGLVVRDVDGGDAQLAGQTGDLRAQFGAEPAVQVGQRLVHEEQARPADDGPTHRHPLALPAAELAGPAGEHVTDTQGAGHVADPLAPRARLDAGEPQREGDVVADRHVWIEGEVLEDHGDPAVPRREVVGQLAVEQDGALGRILQTRDHPQDGRLPAARRAEQHHELAVVDVQVDAVDGDGAVLEDLRDILERDGGHRHLPHEHAANPNDCDEDHEVGTSGKRAMFVT